MTTSKAEEAGSKKPVTELVEGDVITAFVEPDGTLLKMRGGPFEVKSIRVMGGVWEGAAQVEITCTNRNRAPRYNNGSTHVIVE